jgi:hypothetical protein
MLAVQLYHTIDHAMQRIVKIFACFLTGNFGNEFQRKDQFYEGFADILLMGMITSLIFSSISFKL